MIPTLPEAWTPLLAAETRQPYFNDLRAFVAAERAAHAVYPPAHETFAALQLTDPATLRVVILGQDPYHGPGQAHGLSFSVRDGVPLPPSLRNIYRELDADLGIPPAAHGDLSAWARQGVLLLNSGLTVRAHDAASHSGAGWERFTDRILVAVAEHRPGAIFMLWGNAARAKRPLLGAAAGVIESPHPSPLSAYRGFFGSQPFSRCNAALEAQGLRPIDWRLE
jgi:uracil-DNA glycosylase